MTSTQAAAAQRQTAPSDAVLGELLGALPPETVVTDSDVVEGYRRDRADTATAGRPLAVVRATCTADVQAAVRVAARHQVPVVARGAGSGLAGGANAIDGGLVICLEGMSRIEVDPAAMLAVVQPGALNGAVKEAAREHRLWYPPDPSSYEFCSIGGNLATNAGGLCCVKYGVTTDYVLGLEVVLADGRVVRLGGRTIKDVAGYDLKRLFVGSEGTLGIITEATLRLRPLPPASTTLVATFATMTDAGRTVSAVMATMRPSVLELMDQASIRAVEAYRSMELDTDAGALLLARSDAGAAAAEEVARIAACCESEGATFVATTDDEAEGEMFMTARRVAFLALFELGTVLIEDVGVPIPRIADLVSGVERIAASHGTQIATVGHAGDGNFHPLVLFDSTDPEATARAEAAFSAVMQLGLDLGGTITGEHGVGTLKAPYLSAQLGEDVLDLSRRVKQAIDPDNILNPGKVW